MHKPTHGDQQSWAVYCNTVANSLRYWPVKNLSKQNVDWQSYSENKKGYLILTSHSIIEWLYRSILSFLFSVTFTLLILILIYNT